MALALLEEFGIGDASARAEAWRYSATALRALGQQDFIAAEADAAVPAALLARCDWAPTRGRRFVFVNGAFSPRHSDWSALRAAVPDLRVEIAADSTSIVMAPHRADRLHFVYISIPAATASRWRHKLALELTCGSAELIEQHIGADGADVIGALTSEYCIADGADLRTTTISDLPGSASLYRRENIAIQTDAAYRATHAIFGARLQRFDHSVQLRGKRAQYASRGVFALRGREHADIHLDIRHDAGDSASDVFWRGVADQRARGILHGAITVAAGADGADARLQTKNLLLSPHAEIDAQPVLEIHADEVKASHGATVGQLDERALFYLRSRGVPAAIARTLLIAGFCAEAFERIDDDELRARLDALLAGRLPQAGQLSA